MPHHHRDEYELIFKEIDNYVLELYDLMKTENYLLCFGAIYKISKYWFFKYFCAEVTDLHNNVSILMLRDLNWAYIQQTGYNYFQLFNSYFL